MIVLFTYQIKTPTDIPKKAQEKESFGSIVIRALGFIVAMVSFSIVAIHALPSFCLTACVLIPIIVCECDVDDATHTQTRLAVYSTKSKKRQLRG